MQSEQNTASKFGKFVTHTMVIASTLMSTLVVLQVQGVMRPAKSSWAKKTVLKLTEKHCDKNYHVYFDNYFTGVPLPEELLQRGTCGCGTMRINQKGLPQELQPAIKDKKGKENALCFAKTKKEHLKKSGHTVMFQKGQVSVVAWIEKKGRKVVVIASTTISPTFHPR